MWGARGPFLPTSAMVAVVEMVVVGRWKLVTSDFLFPIRLTIFLTCDRAAKTRVLGERILLFGWFSCPILYGSPKLQGKTHYSMVFQ